MMPAAATPRLTRRATLLGLTAVTLGRTSLALAAAPTERRFIVIILRGAMDGLATVVPYGDPALAGHRSTLVLPPPGQEGGVLDLGGFFGLHPALANLHAMYNAGEALAVHAVAGPYRARSHFEAQDLLESGAERRMTSGWLNRALGALPAAPRNEAVAIGVAVPLLLRGPAVVGGWAPRAPVSPDADLYARIAALSQHDRLLGPAIATGLSERGFSAGVIGDDRIGPGRFTFPAMAKAAGELLRADDGPRIAAMEIGGWDTHAAQPARLAAALRQLDAGLAALRGGLGDAWKQTVVLAMTEFGRTVRGNGTGGTDHGTASVAFIVGGAVAGGRVVADWPGLGPGQLLEDRDLQPTADLRSVAKGLLGEHLGLTAPTLAAVFPDSAGAAPMPGLTREGPA